MRIILSFVVFVFSLSSLASEELKAQMPKECVSIFTEDTLLGDGQYWRASVDFESLSFSGFKKHALQFIVDSSLKYIIWSSDWSIGSYGRLNLEDSSLYFRSKSGLIENKLDIKESAMFAKNILEGSIVHADVAQSFVRDSKNYNTASCFKKLVLMFSGVIR